MWQKTVNWIIGILLLVSLICNSILIYQKTHQVAPERLEIHDTILIKKDSIIEKTLYETYVDTFIDVRFVNLSDTFKMKDTIRIPIEHKMSEFNIQKDSLSIQEKIFHSGYRSSIDSIQVSYELNYSIPQPKRKRYGLVWNIGVYAGYGVNFNNGQYYFSPEVGIGASIGFGGIIK